MNESAEPAPDEQFHPDAETLADAESLDYKHRTRTDPAHHLQTKAGASVGALGGAGVGAIVGGPVGALVGAVIGGISGAAAGKMTGQMFDPSAEVEYWRAHHGDQTYVKPDTVFEDYEPAYRTGYNNFTPGEPFEQAEPDLRRYYEERGGQARLSWDDARSAVKAAWDRMSYIFPPEKLNRF